MKQRAAIGGDCEVVGVSEDEELYVRVVAAREARNSGRSSAKLVRKGPQSTSTHAITLTIQIVSGSEGGLRSDSVRLLLLFPSQLDRHASSLRSSTVR